MASDPLVCLECGRVVLERRADGILVLPDAASFRREHGECLRRAAEAAGTRRTAGSGAR
jgi:hypothetical protein